MRLRSFLFPIFGSGPSMVTSREIPVTLQWAKIGAYTTHTVKCNFKISLLRMMQSNFRAYSCTLMLIVAMYALPHYLYSVIFNEHLSVQLYPDPLF